MTLDDAIESLNAYADQGRPTGHFLQAVLENDLMESFGRADETSRLILFDICKHVYNKLPSICWGSRERVLQWLEKKRSERQTAEEAPKP